MISSECTTQATRRRISSFPASRKIDYSLFFLTALCSVTEPCSTRRIAKEGGISFSFLQKIAHLLKRAGIVDATRGKDGGYILARSPHVIMMKDVIEAVDGRLAPFVCAEPPRVQRSCPRRNFCRARSMLAKAQQEALERYFSKSLSDMLY